METIINNCGNCKNLKIYNGSRDPDDPPFCSCGKNVFEYLHPECEWDGGECAAKETEPITGGVSFD